MSASPDIFIVSDASRNDPVDQLGRIGSVGPFPSSAPEITNDPQVNNGGEGTTLASEEGCMISVEGSSRRDNLLSPLYRIQKYDSFQISSVKTGNIQLPVLQHFFDISYIFWTSPFTRHRSTICWCRFRHAIFLLFIAFSSLDALISSNVAFTRKDTKAPHRYTEMGFHAVELFSRLYHGMVLWSLSGKLHVITRMLLRLDDSFSNLVPLVPRQPMELPGYNMIIFLFGILPLIAAALWGVFDFWSIRDWSLVSVLYTGARDLGRTFLVWDMGNFDVANNKTETILFVSTPDSVWISLGLLRVVGKMAANLQDFAMRNLLLAVSMSLIKHTIPLSKVFRKLGNRLAHNVQYGPVQVDVKLYEETWKYYFRVRKTSQELNKTFSGLVKFIHMTNMLMLMYFMLTVVMREHTPITFVLFLYDITMIYLFYISSTIINDVNDDARKWIKDNAVPISPIEVDGRTLQILLDDIRQAPVGIGTGISFIDGGLVQRFVGLLSSLLMFMLDADSQPATGIENAV